AACSLPFLRSGSSCVCSRIHALPSVVRHLPVAGRLSDYVASAGSGITRRPNRRVAARRPPGVGLPPGSTAGHMAGWRALAPSGRSSFPELRCHECKATKGKKPLSSL
ncbi:MAG: hypothetical protein ABUM51_01455, partial [Bacteroidota bacterium]